MSASFVKTLMLLVALSFSGWLNATELTLQPRNKVNAPHISLEPGVHDWLRDHPVIDVAVWGPSHPPIGEGMARGEYQGMGADYLSLLENMLKIRFKLHYYADSSDALSALSRHEIQMLAMWSPQRWPSEDAVATTPWLLDQAVLLQRQDAAEPPAEGKLGVVPDDISPAALKNAYPDNPLRYFREFDNAVNAVSYGQINALWLNRTSADYLLRYHQTQGLKWVPSRAMPNLNLSFGIDREAPQLLSAINSAMQQIPLASRMSIANGWGLQRNAVLTKNPLGLDAEEEEWLQTHNKIRVILSGHRPPISFIDTHGEPAGLVVDIFAALTQRYGLKFDLQLADNNAALIAMQQAYPDALTANRWVQETATSLVSGAASHTAPLVASPMIVIMMQGTPRPEEFEQLKGERLAINRENPLIPWLEIWYPSIQLTLTDDLYQAMQLLKQHNVRGVIAPQLIANYMIQHADQNIYEPAIALPLPSAQLVVAPINALLPLQIVRKALLELPPEQMIELTAPWFHQASDGVLNQVEENPWVALFVLLLAAITLLSGIWIYRLYYALKRGKQSKIALTDQLNFTKTLIDSTPVALYARDRKGHLLHANQYWRNTVKQDTALLMGKGIGEISSIEPAAREQLEQRYQQALEKGEPQYWSAPIRFDDELHYLEGWTVPWRDGRGEIGGLIGGWLDMTAKETLLANLKTAKEQLEQVNNSKTAFMQSMGHEVRTPLNAIIGLLEIELQSQRQVEQPSENLPLIWQSACSLLSLIGDVFDIFRADNQDLRGLIRSVHLPQLIESIVALYRLQAEEKGLTVEIDVELKTVHFEIDTLLIIRIFSSLLRNAIKHSSGDTVSVAIFQGREEQGNKRVPLVIEVANEGLIDEQVLTEKFDSHCTEQGWSATGIQLGACQHMAKANGAELTFESDEESGTIVSFHFSASPSQAVLSATAQPVTHRLRILIAEDYPPSRRALQQQLEGWGHQVIASENGEQALQVWRQNPDALDLVITDCTMPVMDGFALAAKIRQHEQEQNLTAMPLFGLTAMTGFETTMRCLEAGMNECLVKPLSLAALQAVIERYFPKTRRQSPAPSPDASDYSSLHAEMLTVNLEDAEKLRLLLAAKNRVETGRLAHRIRGGATLLKEDELYQACRALEQTCKETDDWELIVTLAEKVFLQLENVNGKLLTTNNLSSNNNDE